MSLKLMYISNNPVIASIAERSGVNWIFIDLEIRGKDERQGHLDTVISRHQIEDIKKVKNVLNRSNLLVRVNAFYTDSKDEITKVISEGADIVMLPYFKTRKEVESFLSIVNGKAKTCLLCETPEAVNEIDDIISIPEIDYVHIGLNDLHLGYRMKFMFELLADGTVEKLCKKFRAKGIEYGFGGIARLGGGALPAEKVIAEHYRLGSQMAILSRSFCNTSEIKETDEIEKIFQSGVKEIRQLEKSLLSKNAAWFENNHREVVKAVQQIIQV